MSQRLTNKRRLIVCQHGSVLLLVLVAIIIMSLTTSTYLLLMRNEHLAARYSGNHLKTEMLTRSGLAYLQVFLNQTDADLELQGGVYDNANSLRDVLVVDDSLPRYRGRFTVIAPAMTLGVYQNSRYGLENESGKLNLNALVASDSSSESESGTSEGASTTTLSARDRLLMIPGMNEVVADAIMDWIDEDDSPRANGFEADYYSSLATSYVPTNGPIRHLDELLMVQGVTPELLYGLDTNRNYIVDPDELPRGALAQLDNTQGDLNRGWSAYFTVTSWETNSNPEGEEKLDLNTDDLQTLQTDLQQYVSAGEANFIIAYRQYGPADESAEGDTVPADALEIDFEQNADTQLASPLDLIGARILIEGEGGSPDQLVESPWQDNPANYQQSFATLLDVATTDTAQMIAGRININEAARPVLMTIPGMTAALADQIVARRDPTLSGVDGVQRHPTWLLADSLISLDEMKPMFPLITTGGDVYSAQIIGFFDEGTARARTHVLLHRAADAIELLDWQDWSKLGPGFSRSVLSAFTLQNEQISTP